MQRLSETYPFEELVDSIGFHADFIYDRDELTREEWGRVVTTALLGLGRFECVWCGVNTSDIGEYYALRDDLWKQHGPHRGHLCIGCLEQRLGRQLKPADFMDVPVNTDPGARRSKRLADRLGR